MTLKFLRGLGFYIRKTNIRAQKIDYSALKTFRMVIVNFQLEDKIGKTRFFYEIFFMADTKFQVILRMFILKLWNANV